VSFDRTTTVNISGSKNLDLVIPTQALAAGTATKDALALVDGSSATGKLSITLNLDGTGADNINTSLAVKGGSAADTFIVVATAPEAGNNLTITGGAGNDKFNVEGLTATTPATSSFLTIADFTKGDQIDGVNTAAAFVSTKFDVGAATTVDEAIGLALAGAANDVRWFQFGGNTFVVYDTAGGGAAASDLVVRATGLLDLSNSTLGAGNGVLTFG
jgi:hypothetical protein